MVMAEEKLMVTVSGPDRPGIMADFSLILVRHGVEAVEVQQASLQGFLGLYFLLDLANASTEADTVIKDLLYEANRSNLNLQFRLLAHQRPEELAPARLYVLTHFGGTRVLAELSRVLFEEGVNIETIATFAHHGTRSMEMVIDARSVSSVETLKRRIMVRSRELNTGLGIQKMEAYRKNKRLVFFDMDSTLVDMEVIDEMARRAGVHREVVRVTEKAMRGEIDFEESLIQRVGLLKGLRVGELEDIRKNIPLNPGVEDLVTTLKWLGYKLGIVTGGFDFFSDYMKKKLGFDYAFANRLEIKSDTLTGRVAGEIVDGARKARIVNQTACDLGIHLDQTVVVGDGANDALMLAQAGLAIAYNGKRRLDRVANAALGPASMTDMLHLLGITEEDIAEALACKPPR
jgi:phosphoserine phosphatase